jgi:hypothetical protein
MNVRMSAVAGILIAAVGLSRGSFGQAGPNGHVQPKFCSTSHRGGRRIVSNLEIVEFHVPRLARMTKVADVDYVEYYVRYGREQDRLWLRFMFGPYVGGEQPHDLGNTSIKWTEHEWGCHQDKDGTDWSGMSTDGRRWRHISIPFGFASYEGAPQKAADYFDKILDTMCCGRCPYCEK